MPNNKLIRFLVSKDQYERICFNAKAKGFKTVSDYLRDSSLKNSLFIEKKIKEIDKKLELLTENAKQNGTLPIRVTQNYEKIEEPFWIKELKKTGIID